MLHLLVSAFVMQHWLPLAVGSCVVLFRKNKSCLRLGGDRWLQGWKRGARVMLDDAEDFLLKREMSCAAGGGCGLQRVVESLELCAQMKIVGREREKRSGGVVGK